MESLTMFFGRNKNTSTSIKEYEASYDRIFGKKKPERLWGPITQARKGVVTRMKNKERKLNEELEINGIPVDEHGFPNTPNSSPSM